MPQPVVSMTDLPELLPGRYLLEGRHFGLNTLTLVLGESSPGQTSPRHRHDYEEAFIVHAGRGIYTVGERTVEARPGDVVVVPAGVLHRFANQGDEPLRHTAVHATGTFALETLMEPSQ